MDFYLDFMRELEKGHVPESTLGELVVQIKSVIEKAPVRVALAQGAALLAVIHDYQNPQAIQILPAFRDVKESVEMLLASLDADIDLEEHLWGEDGRISPHVGDPEEQPQEGLSQRFLAFEGIETWGKARWAAFVAQLDLAIDIAASAPTGLDSMFHLLAEIRDNFIRIPMENQEQALIAADRLVLAIREDMERAMDTMQDRYQFELIADLGDWNGEDDPPERFAEEPPDADETTAFFTSEIQPRIDLSGWADWSEEDWATFDQAVANAQAAAIAEPANPEPAIRLFLGIRQNVENLELHRRFNMGNVADDLLEAVKKGMAQDLFHVQEKCPCVPWPLPVAQDTKQSLAPVPDGTKGHWKKGRLGRELVELNFDQIANWSLSQWAGLKIEVDKLTAATEMSADALGQPGQLLEDIRAHIQQIPPHYRGEVDQMATKLEQAISGKVAEALAKIQQVGD